MCQSEVIFELLDDDVARTGGFFEFSAFHNIHCLASRKYKPGIRIHKDARAAPNAQIVQVFFDGLLKHSLQVTWSVVKNRLGMGPFSCGDGSEMNETNVAAIKITAHPRIAA